MNSLISKGIAIPESTLLALFFAPGESFRAVSIAGEISDRLVPVFSAEPSVFPLPDAPAEFPRIVLEQPSVGRLTVSYARADLLLEWKSDEGWKGRICSLTEALAGALIEKSSLSVNRLGFIITFKLSDTLKLEELRKHYILPSKIYDAQELNLAWYRMADVNNLKVNRWVRFSLAAQPTGNRSLAIDHNTILGQIGPLSPNTAMRLVNDFMGLIWSDFDELVEW